MINKIVVLGMAALLASATASFAQENNRDRGGENRDRRGGWDPAAMQQRMMDGVKDRLEITDETEWKAVQPLVEKVMNAQRQIMGERMRGFMGRRGGDSDRRGPGGDSDRRPGFGGAFGAPNPDAETLQKAIDTKASKSEMKAALDKYAASRKARQAELEAAQAELRKVLTTRQEAIATLSGLL